MIKKILLSMVVLIALAVSAQAENVVGRNKVKPVDQYAKNKGKITLIKPQDSANSIKLISLDDFLKAQKEETVIIYPQVEEGAVEEKTVMAEEKDREEITEDYATQQDKPDMLDKIDADEIYISYDSDKKTLLSLDAKESLKELVNKAQNEGAKIGIISYAAGEPAMARRVALLRANIIKNTLKSLGVNANDIDVQSFGNQVNINQSKAFLVK